MSRIASFLTGCFIGDWKIVAGYCVAQIVELFLTDPLFINLSSLIGGNDNRKKAKILFLVSIGQMTKVNPALHVCIGYLSPNMEGMQKHLRALAFVVP